MKTIFTYFLKIIFYFTLFFKIVPKELQQNKTVLETFFKKVCFWKNKATFKSHGQTDSKCLFEYVGFKGIKTND